MGFDDFDNSAHNLLVGSPDESTCLASRKSRIWNAFHSQLVRKNYKLGILGGLAVGVKEAWLQAVEIVCADLAALLCRKAFYCEINSRDLAYTIHIYQFEYRFKGIKDKATDEGDFFYVGEEYSKEDH